MEDLGRALSGWESGRRAARQRFDEALSELDRILAHPIEQGLTDPTRWLRTIENSERRLGELRRGVEHAWSPLERLLESARADDAVDSQHQRRIEYQVAEQRKRRDRMLVYMAREGRALLAARRSDAARSLYPRALNEWREPRRCPDCSASIDVGALMTSAVFLCPECGATPSFGPGGSGQMYFAEIEAVCDEQTLDEWTAFESAKRTFDGYVWPTEGDFDVLETAARTWLSEWVSVWFRLVPEELTSPRDELVAEKLQEVLAPVNTQRLAKDRERMGEAMRLAAASDMAGVLQLINRDGLVPVDFVVRLCQCLHEHGNREAAWQALALLHHLKGESTERDSWMQQRLMALDDQMRTR